MQDRFNNKYRISSTRLPGWDYSSPGMYYVTICTKGRKCWFGNIEYKQMKLSKAGKIAEQCWTEIPDHYHNISLFDFIVMPNHVHGILFIDYKLQVRTLCRDGACPVSTTLGNIIGSYKSAVSRYARQINPSFSWQPRFYEHVIRNERSLKKFAELPIPQSRNMG